MGNNPPQGQSLLLLLLLPPPVPPSSGTGSSSGSSSGSGKATPSPKGTGQPNDPTKPSAEEKNHDFYSSISSFLFLCLVFFQGLNRLHRIPVSLPSLWRWSFIMSDCFHEDIVFVADFSRAIDVRSVMAEAAAQFERWMAA